MAREELIAALVKEIYVNNRQKSSINMLFFFSLIPQYIFYMNANIALGMYNQTWSTY